VQWHNTVFARSSPLSVHKLLTSCIRRVSRACDWVTSALSAAWLIFSFQFNLLFFHISVVRQHQHYGVLLLLIRNIGYRALPKIWVGTFPVRSVHPSGKTELIRTVKMEARHPVEGQFGSEFPAIYNHCGVMTAWSRKTWKFCEQFLRFFKTTPYGKIFKILFRKFSSPHQSTLSCSNVIQFVRREIGEIVRYLNAKNFACLSNCCYCTHCAQNLLRPAPDIVLTVFQISSKSVKFRPSNSRTRQHRFLPRRVFPWFARSYDSLRANNKLRRDSTHVTCTHFNCRGPAEGHSRLRQSHTLKVVAFRCIIDKCN